MILRQCSFVVVALAGALIPASYAQTKASMSAEITAGYTRVKTNLLRSAEKMPDDAYAFKPTPEIRSFAEVMAHVASAQSRTCGALNHSQAEVPAPEQHPTTKAQVTQALQAAFAACDKAYASLNDSNAMEEIQTPRGVQSRLGALAGNVAHDSEQYGIIAMYLRLKGLVPPSSEK